MRRAVLVRGSSAVLAMALLSGCAGIDADGSSTSPQKGGENAKAAVPLDNPKGERPSLAALTSDADQKAGRKVIEQVRTAGRGPKTGYERDRFGPTWTDTADGVALARNGCDTRNDILARDGEKVKYRSGSDCVVVEMTLHDPYTGDTIAFEKAKANEVQIDHVMPLSYDWQMGAARWTADKREQIANDPLNLIAVDGPTNGSKSDSGPASWLPPVKRIRCAYSVRFAQVALKYDLPVTTADKQIMLEQCGG
ncbi:HNH endonuclease family protein [Actinocorallia longicatena]|uniref:HNH endonuclease family protein n=1 Tax=Actinocorallia longicatena TaxID=111803 RepID=A0ABP6Q5N8_9ACTN